MSFPVLFRSLHITIPRKIKSVLPKKTSKLFCPFDMKTKSRKNQKIDYFKWLKLKWTKKSWVTLFALWLFVENRRWDVGRRKKKYCDKIGSCLKTKEYQNWKPSFIVTSFLVAKTNGKSGGRQTFKSGKHEIHKTKIHIVREKKIFCLFSKCF